MKKLSNITIFEEEGHVFKLIDGLVDEKGDWNDFFSIERIF